MGPPRPDAQEPIRGIYSPHYGMASFAKRVVRMCETGGSVDWNLSESALLGQAPSLPPFPLPWELGALKRGPIPDDRMVQEPRGVADCPPAKLLVVDVELFPVCALGSVCTSLGATVVTTRRSTRVSTSSPPVSLRRQSAWDSFKKEVVGDFPRVISPRSECPCPQRRRPAR